MKPIALKNTDDLADALSEAQGKARERTLDVEDLQTAAKQAEHILSTAGVPKTYWKGADILVNPYRVPNAYKSGQATKARLTRRSADWALTWVERTWVDHASYGVDVLLATKVTLYVPVEEYIPSKVLPRVLAHHGIDLAPRRTPDQSD